MGTYYMHSACTLDALTMHLIYTYLYPMGVKTSTATCIMSACGVHRLCMLGGYPLGVIISTVTCIVNACRVYHLCMYLDTPWV